ncbi:p78/83 [Clostera anastomosis granulovirus B]|uniref:p78/83 n=1 Tax=Clostera anastomosis granulovirus B TaxID=1986290 RepID=A0A0K0WS18_9BBAC|nr:p78/83 [Clostera anastomosis granulovirus B]AKS25345.1 p78/83 [Clostera anastomosis granulovirus B]
MDLLGFIRQNNFNADVRDTIKLMKWNNSLKRKLDAKTDVISITTEELVEFMESVYQMIVKRSSHVGTIKQPPLMSCDSSASQIDATVSSPVISTTPTPVVLSPPVVVVNNNNDVNISACDKDLLDYDMKVVDTN